jgi:hypothetical protein
MRLRLSFLANQLGFEGCIPQQGQGTVPSGFTCPKIDRLHLMMIGEVGKRAKWHI